MKGVNKKNALHRANSAPKNPSEINYHQPIRPGITLQTV